jgi:hypothetical protein
MSLRRPDMGTPLPRAHAANVLVAAVAGLPRVDVLEQTAAARTRRACFADDDVTHRLQTKGSVRRRGTA